MAGKRKSPKQKMTAKAVIQLLRDKHVEDVFVSECKGGSTWRGRETRLDGWAMKKSWANPMFIGYEVKVSRGDFLQDEKWTGYLPFCTRFYFVCPWGMIDKSEVGEKAGLMYVTKNNARLVTQKKAPVLESNVEARDSLMRYVLMSRVQICESTFGGRSPDMTNEEYWERWLRQKQDYRIMGRSVSKKLTYLMEKKIHAVEMEAMQVHQKNEQLEEIREFLKELGIDPKGYVHKSQVDRKLNRQFKNVRFVVNSAIGALETLRDKLDKETDDGR